QPTEISSNWRAALNTVIERYARPLNAIIADPATSDSVRQNAMRDLTELYARYGEISNGVTSGEGLNEEATKQLSDLNAWIAKTMPQYQDAFQATVARGRFDISDQVSINNSAAETGVEWHRIMSQFENSSPLDFLNRVRATPTGSIDIV